MHCFCFCIKINILIITVIGSSSQVSYDHCSYERNLSNCVEKPEKVSSSTGFEPVVVVVSASIILLIGF